MLKKILMILLFVFWALSSFAQTTPTNPDSIPFAPAVNYETGYHPISVFCADLDNDTDLDLAVTNTWADSVSILWNNGGGEFQNSVNYLVVGSPFSVFCADLDKDNDLDLAVANHWSHNVSILKNNGNGTFGSLANYGVGRNPYTVFCADLDNDTDLDLAVANYWSYNVSIWKNNGDGTFDSLTNYATGGYPTSVFCADIDDTLGLDLAVAKNGTDDVSIWKNNGNGTFYLDGSYTTGDFPISVFCADLDGDGDSDLVTANRDNGSVSILENNGNGTFQTRVDYGVGSGPHSVFCADLDGDGDADLAVANHWSHNVSILRNNGNGSFSSAVNYKAGNGPATVFCADIDSDKDLDLVVANSEGNNVSILFNLTISVGSISGTVSDSLGGVLGVAVDLFDSTGTLAQFAYTDTSGFFQFDSVDAGDYTVSIVTPLGYVADFESRPITVTINADSVVNFTLHALEIVPSQRSMGYWKHQVNVHLSGRGHAQESLADMSNYMSLIREHFNNNLANPITIFEVPQPATQTDSLEALKDLLTVKGNRPMSERAKQQLIALMLNVVSLKLHQTTPISEDSATVSQAITYCNQLITDSNPTNDEIAKDIADNINNGILVASGVIPLTTPNIAYKGGEDQNTQTPSVPKEFSLSQNYPNPFNPVCNIEYALPIDCHVTLTIYNILGQRVRVLVDEYQSAGNKSAKWDGKDEQGQEVTSGVYFHRIQAGDFVQAKKMVLIK